MNYFELWLLVLICSLIWIYIIRKLFVTLKLMDKPKDYWFTRDPVPYPAWIIIPILFFWISFQLVQINKPFIWFFLSALILAITSFYDDRYKISPFLRLWIQLVCALLIVASGIWINEILNPYWGEISLISHWIDIFGHIFYPIADTLLIIWVIWMINSLNWIDWISWNASGVGMIGWWVLFFLAISDYVHQWDMAQIFLIFAVICSVFFIFDLEKPKILMWDSGSMFIGLALATFSVLAGWKIATTIMVMMIPLMDFVFTIVRRLYSKKSPFRGDEEHFHHILIKNGLSRRWACLTYLLLCICIWLPALFMQTQGKFIALVLWSIVILWVQFWLRMRIKEQNN